MALLRSVPTTALGRAVREQHDAARQTRRSWRRRFFKAFAVVMVALWGALGIGSGTAQAGWPWEDVTTAVVHICGPMDLPSPTTYRGFDTSLGLNDVENSNQRGTILPKMEDGMGDEGDGLERLSKAYSDNAEIIAKPSYERYGFSTLTWTNYGNGCASKAFWLSGVTNFAFDIFVKFPMILGMGLLDWSMNPDNVIFRAFGAMVQPLAGGIGAVLQPWIFFIAPIGVFLVWARTRSTTQVLKSFIWVVSIYGVFMWLTGVQSYSGEGWVQSDNPGVADPRDIDYPEDDEPPGLDGGVATFTAFASNFVTTFSGNAACKISEVSAGGQACDPDDPMGNIHESLWHGIPYQTWLSGELGEQGAAQSRRLEAQGKVNWGGAILNGLYRGDDDKGDDVSRAIAWWNQASYADSTDADAKVGYWSGGNDELPEWSKGTAWEDIPALAVTKFLCNDKSTDDEGSSDEDQNRWMYGGSCDAAGAGTADIVPYYKGEGYSQQIVYAFAGMWAVIAIVITIGLACIYLMVQKMLFFWLLAFGPIFLAISTFGDEKRRAFAKRWAELLVSNVIKQCVAVMVVLFVSYSMSTLLTNESIPWIIKPYAAVLFLIALIMFAKPMAGIAKAAVAGDTSAVDRMANSPQRAAANTAKAAALAGAVAATGGLAAAGAGGVLSGTSLGGAAKGLLSNPQALRTMSRIAGPRGAVGKGLKAIAGASSLKQQFAAAGIAQEGAKAAESNVLAAMLNGPDAGRFREGGDPNGRVTPEGYAAARAEVRRVGSEGARKAKVEAVKQRAVGDWFQAYEADTGERHKHDPRNKAAQNGYKPAEPQGDGTAPAGEERAARPHGPGPEREAIQQMFADDAAERFDQSKAAVDATVATVVERTGSQVLEDLGVTQEQVATSPEDLLIGRVYGNGDTSRMDPGHPATEALTTLRWAAQGTDEEADRARQAAMTVIAAEGVPAEVSSVRAAPEAAEQFHPAQFVGAMTEIADDTSWAERAAAAVTMQRAIAAVPEHHPAGDAADAYVSALANVAYDGGAVEAFRVRAIEAFDQHADWRPGARDEASLYADAEPDGPVGQPAAQSHELHHDPAGLDLAREVTRGLTGRDSAPGNGTTDSAPPPDGGPKPRTTEATEEGEPRVAPRGEEEPVTEYNAPERGRSGIYGYDDDDEDKKPGEAGDPNGDDGADR